MDENNEVKLTQQSFFKWIKIINAGHKRLWVVFTFIWVLSFMIPNVYQYYKDAKYCKAAEDDVSGIVVNGISRETYKKCKVTSNRVETLPRGGKKMFVNSYKMSAKYNFSPTLWAVIPPLVLPIIIFIGVWVYTGYRYNNKI